MKKILALVITFLYFTMNSCFATVSGLYYLKNTDVSKLQNKVVQAYNDRNYKLIKKNPYYGISNGKSSDYAVIILQQSGKNVFYYYKSNSEKKINKNLLKYFTSSGIYCEESENDRIKGIYENLANSVMTTDMSTRYVFSDNEHEQSVRYSPTTQVKNNQTLSGAVVQIAKGTNIGVYLQNPINTATAQVGDQIVAVLTNNWTYKGYTVAPQGSLVYGSLTLAHGAQYGSRNGRVVIKFDRIVTPEGRTINISTEKVDFSVSNDGKWSGAAGRAVGGAVIGALTGLLIGAIAGGHHLGSYTAISAGVGAGGALITTAAARGVDAEIPSFTELELILDQPVRVTLNGN